MFKLNTNQESDISLACPAFPISMILVGKPLLIICPFFCQWNCLKVQVCVCVFICLLIPSVSRVCYLIHSDLLFTSSLFILLFKYSYSFPASLLFSFTKYWNWARLITWNQDLIEQRVETWQKVREMFQHCHLDRLYYYHLFVLWRRRKWCFLTHAMWRDSTLNISSCLLFCNLIKFEIGFEWSPLEPPGSAAQPALI